MRQLQGRTGTYWRPRTQKQSHGRQPWLVDGAPRCDFFHSLRLLSVQDLARERRQCTSPAVGASCTIRGLVVHGQVLRVATHETGPFCEQQLVRDDPKIFTLNVTDGGMALHSKLVTRHLRRLQTPSKSDAQVSAETPWIVNVHGQHAVRQSRTLQVK